MDEREAAISIAISSADVGGADELRRRILGLPLRPGETTTVDLRAASSIDSAMLSAVVASHKLLAFRGERLVVACRRGPLPATFQMTGVSAYISLVA